MKFFLSVIAFCGLFSNTVFANQVMVNTDLVEILSEPQDDLIHTVSLNLDENGDIVEVIRTSEEDELVIPSEDLIEGEVVLARSQDRDAVFLSCPGCTADLGGELVVRYISNGIFNTYDELHMNLVRTGNDWTLFSVDGEEVINLRLVSRTIFGQVIGIREIQINSY